MAYFVAIVSYSDALTFVQAGLLDSNAMWQVRDAVSRKIKDNPGLVEELCTKLTNSQNGWNRKSFIGLMEKHLKESEIRTLWFAVREKLTVPKVLKKYNERRNAILNPKIKDELDLGIEELGKGDLERKPLPYGLKDLEPVISEKALTLHYTMHHKAYVTNFNKLRVEAQ